MLSRCVYLAFPSRFDPHHHGLRDWRRCGAQGICRALGVARNVMVAWIITIPASETVAAAIYGLTTFLGLIQLSR